MVTNRLKFKQIANIDEGFTEIFPYSRVEGFTSSTPGGDQPFMCGATAFPDHVAALTYPIYHIKYSRRTEAAFPQNYNGLWYVVGGIGNNRQIVATKFAPLESVRFNLGYNNQTFKGTFYYKDRVIVITTHNVYVLDPASGNVLVSYNVYELFGTQMYGEYDADIIQYTLGADGNLYIMIADEATVSSAAIIAVVQLGILSNTFTFVIPVTDTTTIGAWVGSPRLWGVDETSTVILMDYNTSTSVPTELYRGNTFVLGSLTSYASIPMPTGYVHVIRSGREHLPEPTMVPNQLPNVTVLPIENTAGSLNYGVIIVDGLPASGGLGTVLYSDTMTSTAPAEESTTQYAQPKFACNRNAPNKSALYPDLVTSGFRFTDRAYEFSLDQDLLYSTSNGELLDSSSVILDPITKDIGFSFCDTRGIMYFLTGDTNSDKDTTISVYTLEIPAEELGTSTDDYLGNDAMYQCRCTKITPINTTLAPAVGFTDHDCDLVIDGLVYKAKGTFEPTAAEAKTNLSVDNVNLKAIFSDDTLDADLIARGAYDGAEILISIVNWYSLPTRVDNPDEVIVIMRGNLGTASVTNMGYEVEARSIESKLHKSVNNLVLPFCPYQLGDSDCTVDLVATANTNLTATVTAVTARNQFEIDTDYSSKHLNYGIVEFTSGDNLGVRREILNYTHPELRMFESFPANIQIGDTVTITAGCDKTESATTGCKLYNNFVNFGGYPSTGNWMVGKDFLYQNPINN